MELGLQQGQSELPERAEGQWGGSQGQSKMGQTLGKGVAGEDGRKKSACSGSKNFNPGCPQVDRETSQREMSQVTKEKCPSLSDRCSVG